MMGCQGQEQGLDDALMRYGTEEMTEKWTFLWMTLPPGTSEVTLVDDIGAHAGQPLNEH